MNGEGFLKSGPISHLPNPGLEEWKSNIFHVYEKMRAKGKEPYEVQYAGLSLAVLPSVYAPEFFDDSEWYARHISDIARGKSLLEIGTGTDLLREEDIPLERGSTTMLKHLIYEFVPSPEK